MTRIGGPLEYLLMATESATAQKQKHVIILGAGASCTSGYPLADRLRVLMSSEKDFQAELIRLLPKDMLTPLLEGSLFFRPNQEAIDLFRHSGFATIDEFSKLAGRRYQKEIQELKKLLRFVLSLHNPEDDFTRSDYYQFVQKLFLSDLASLREDIAIFTFNYDPYLPYLLVKAYHIRCQTAGIKADHQVEDAITSGFACRLGRAIEDGNGLCVLQLHGSIAWPRKFNDEGAVWYEDLFATSAQKRIEQLINPATDATVPPVLFPWEVIQSDGQFLPEAEFCINEREDKKGRRQGGYTGNCSLYQLFVSIWKRARKEITTATKISFIGLSMHDFLNPAFQFLFSDKRDNAALVVANKEHEQFRKVEGPPLSVEAHLNPRSRTFKVRRLLKQICPSIKGMPNRESEVLWSDGCATVKIRETFHEFIQYEMD